MMKQIMRYKLIADQKVGRANRSEVLNEELLQVEKHMELVRSACQTTYKKMLQCMQSHGAGDLEKRVKRLTETNLGMAMSDASKLLLTESDSNQLLGNSLKVCAEAQLEIAKEKAMYECFAEDHIISPLQALVEIEIPNVLKLRERLKKLVLDRDSAWQNYNRTQKALNNPGSNQAQTAAKSELIKDEYDQAVIRMEQCKDQLVTEMFEYLSKEVHHGQRLADFHAKQLEYHRRCVNLLEKLEPNLKDIQDNAVMKSVYGRSLTEHLHMTGREIACPLEACVLCLLELGLKEEGLFRIAGGATKLRKFRALVDGGVLDLSVYDAQDDIHAVAGALKQYLRELPDPLLTHQLHAEWIKCASIQDRDQRMQEITTLIENLPPENKKNFRYLIKFCAVVAANQEVNKMSAGNVALVLAPNLLWSNLSDINTRMLESNLMTGIIELIITYSDWYFPGDIDFVVTPNATSYSFVATDFTANGSELKPNSSGQPTPLSPTPTTNQNRSRHSSSDAELNTTNNVVRTKKQKSKAPPPPQNQSSKSLERIKYSVSGAQAHNAITNGNNVKPPIPVKKASMKKPEMRPPQPPKVETLFAADFPAPPPDLTKVPPRPPVRKHFSESTIPLPAIDDSCMKTQHSVDGLSSTPMPDLPPPPLPSELELELGAGLTSELRFNNEVYPSTDEEEVQFTQL